jgi:hypothetical protein
MTYSPRSTWPLLTASIAVCISIGIQPLTNAAPLESTPSAGVPRSSRLVHRFSAGQAWDVRLRTVGTKYVSITRESGPWGIETSPEVKVEFNRLVTAQERVASTVGGSASSIVTVPQEPIIERSYPAQAAALVQRMGALQREEARLKARHAELEQGLIRLEAIHGRRPETSPVLHEKVRLVTEQLALLRESKANSGEIVAALNEQAALELTKLSAPTFEEAVAATPERAGLPAPVRIRTSPQGALTGLTEASDEDAEQLGMGIVSGVGPLGGDAFAPLVLPLDSVSPGATWKAPLQLDIMRGKRLGSKLAGVYQYTLDRLSTNAGEEIADIDINGAGAMVPITDRATVLGFKVHARVRFNATRGFVTSGKYEVESAGGIKYGRELELPSPEDGSMMKPTATARYVVYLTRTLRGRSAVSTKP